MVGLAVGGNGNGFNGTNAVVKQSAKFHSASREMIFNKKKIEKKK